MLSFYTPRGLSSWLWTKMSFFSLPNTRGVPFFRRKAWLVFFSWKTSVFLKYVQFLCCIMNFFIKDSFLSFLFTCVRQVLMFLQFFPRRFFLFFFSWRKSDHPFPHTHSPWMHTVCIQRPFPVHLAMIVYAIVLGLLVLCTSRMNYTVIMFYLK
jgi:hypothetical protein